ncbi:MAG: phage BR0599 family protein [Pseudomonadota bacterium]
MTFATYEVSRQDGSPVELYDFFFGTLHYRYTNVAVPQAYDGETFDPIPITRGNIDSRTSFDNTTMRITAAGSIGIAALYRIQPPSGIVYLTIRSKHREDPDEQFAVSWTGRLLEVTRKRNEVELNCEPLTVSLKRTGLAENFQKSCTRTLYRPGCNVDKDLFVVEGALTLVDATTVTLAGAEAMDTNWFAGGYLEYVNTDNGVLEYRPIDSSSGGNLVLMLPVVNLAATGKAYAGCARTVAVCIAKFDNLNNYGGVPTLPTLNPFGGTDIF